MRKLGVEQTKVLVVDDEECMREIVRQALEGVGYLVEEASDGASALAMIGQCPYDVIITDLRLPAVPGEKLLREALAIFPETIVIIMTGYGNIRRGGCHSFGRVRFPAQAVSAG